MKINKFKLRNGLRVIIVPKKEGHTVGVTLAVRFGSNYEKEKHAGIAHFIEHMVFKGTKKRDKFGINYDTEKVGGFIGAGTDFETTTFYCAIPKKHVEVALDVISDLAFNSVFDPNEIKLERNVVLEDKMLWDTNPSMSILELFPKTIFTKHPVAKPTIGKVETINKMRREDFLYYYNKYYVPSNMVLVIVGNINMRSVRALVNKYFNAPSKPAPRLPTFRETTKITKPRKSISKRDVTQANFIIGFRFADAKDKNWLTGKVMQNILSGGMSGRLFKEIRNKRGLVYDVFADYNAFLDYGMFEIYAGSKPKNIEKVKKLILAEFERLRTEKVSKRELDDIKTSMEGRFLMESERNIALSQILASYEIVSKAEDYLQYLKKLKKVKSEDIQKLASKYFNPKEYGFAAIVPK